MEKCPLLIGNFFGERPKHTSKAKNFRGYGKAKSKQKLGKNQNKGCPQYYVTLFTKNNQKQKQTTDAEQWEKVC